MSIEFRCTQCQRLLRTQDDAAGKQAKCPECGTILVVPAAETSVPAAPPPPGSASGPASPFAPGPSPGSALQNPYQSPTDYMPGPVRVEQTGVITPTPIDLGDILHRTWTVLKNQYGITLGVFIVVWLLNMAANGFATAGTKIVEASGNEPAVVMTTSVFLSLLQWLFSTWIGVGGSLCFLKIARGQPASMGEIFSGGPYFLRVLVGWVLFGLIIGGVVMICVMPAMILTVALVGQGHGVELPMLGLALGTLVAFIPSLVVVLGLHQFQYAILDRNVGIRESFALSWRITRGNKMAIFSIWLVASIAGAIVTVLTCLLGGLFLAAPFWSLLMPVMYLAMSGQPTADRFYQPMRTPQA